MTKVLITDDHPVVRMGIRQILEDDEKINLIHETNDGKELIGKIMDQEYDVILLDISLPGRSGLDIIAQIKKISKKLLFWYLVFIQKSCMLYRRLRMELQAI
jgi:DNA-binding NarL/FixJ family response regulator